MAPPPSRLSIRTMGAVAVTIDDGPIDIRSTKAMALLVYLAETDRPHFRSALAGLLWPDQPEASARNNLRQALTALRKTVGEHIATPGDRVHLAGDVTIDTRPLSAEGYRGPFLDGFTVPDSDLFDEWTTRTRTTHEVMARSLLLETAEACLASGAVATGLIAAHRILDMEPWNEQAHRVVMRLLATDGRKHEAIEQYDRCASALWEHLGTRPDPTTDRLLAELDSATGLTVGTAIEVPATPMFGRDAEIARLSDTLTSGDRRLLTLVGPGGIGKTRLALALADAVREHFVDGVAVAALEGVDDPARVVASVASAVGIIPAEDDASELPRRLATRAQLILIDNAEQVVGAVADLARSIVRVAPAVRLLVTSRVALDLSIEQIERLEGLPVTATDPDEPCAAVQLFVDRARRVAHDVRPGPTVQAICARLGGFPLAIELAAGRMGQLSAEEILEAVGQSTQALTTDLRDVAERHRSVTDLLEDTLASLPPELVLLVDRLSVFRGGFDRPAAQTVANADARSLQQLAARSLLMLRSGDRYEMHELIRQHAASRLEVTGDPTSVADAHARHHLAVLGEAEPDFYGARSSSVIDRLLPDLDNIVAAWHHAVEREDAQLVRRSARAMYRLAVVSGRQREIVDMLESASQAFGGTLCAELLGYVVALTWARSPAEATEERCRRGMAAAGSTPADRRARAVLSTDLGQTLAELRGDTDGARRWFDEARALLVGIDDPDLAAYHQVAAAKNEITAGDFDTAANLLVPALRYYEESGHLAGAADAHSRMAILYAEQYRVGPALIADLEALRLYTELNNDARAADGALNSGASYVLCGAWDEAEELTMRAMRYFEEVGDPLIIPYTMCQIAEIHAGRGQIEAAERWFVEGIAGVRHLDHSLGLRLKLPEWGRFLVETNRCRLALLALDEAAAIWRAIGGRHFLLTVQAISARALNGVDRRNDAVALASEVWDDIEARKAQRLPYPIESIADCARVLTSDDPRYPAMIDLGRSVAAQVAGEITDPRLQESFLNLADVRFVMDGSEG